MKTRVTSAGLSLLVIAAGWLAGHLTGHLLFPPSPEAPNAVSPAVQNMRGLPHAADRESAAAGETLVSLMEAAQKPGHSNPVHARATAFAEWLEKLKTTEDFERALAQLPPAFLADSRGTNKPLPPGFAFFKTWMNIDRPAALRAVARLAQGRFRDDFICTAMSEWQNTDLMGALDFVLSNPGPIEANAAASVVRALTEKDPVKAIEVLRRSQAERWVSDAVWVWASKSPDAALRWCLEQPPSADSLKNLTTAFSSFGDKHLHEALNRAAKDLVDPGQRGEVLKALFKHGGEEAIPPAERLQLVLQFSEGPVRQEVLDGFPLPSGNLAGIDQSILSLAGTLAEGDERTAFLKGQIRKLLFDVKSCGLEIVNLASAIPAGDGRREVLKALGAAWSSESPEAAGAWLATQPPSDDRDAVVASFAPALMRTDPAAAMDWSMSVSDELLRWAALQKQYAEWLTRDAAAAGKWLQTSKLTEAEKAALTN